MSSTSPTTTTDVRPQLAQAAEVLRELLAGLSADDLERPGLGEWNVRELCGHTLRAFATARSYYEGGATGDPPTFSDPGEYFRTALANPAVHEGISARAREAAIDVGDDPVAAFDRALAATQPVIDGADLDAVIAVAAGSMTFAQYLRTRLFELVVHTDDLCRALGVINPTPDPVLRAVLSVVVDAAAGDQLVALLRASTGRSALPDGFTVLG